MKWPTRLEAFCFFVLQLIARNNRSRGQYFLNEMQKMAYKLYRIQQALLRLPCTSKYCQVHRQITLEASSLLSDVSIRVGGR